MPKLGRRTDDKPQRDYIIEFVASRTPAYWAGTIDEWGIPDIVTDPRNARRFSTIHMAQLAYNRLVRSGPYRIEYMPVARQETLVMAAWGYD